MNEDDDGVEVIEQDGEQTEAAASEVESVGEASADAESDSEFVPDSAAEAKAGEGIPATDPDLGPEQGPAAATNPGQPSLATNRRTPAQRTPGAQAPGARAPKPRPAEPEAAKDVASPRGSTHSLNKASAAYREHDLPGPEKLDAAASEIGIFARVPRPIRRTVDVLARLTLGLVALGLGAFLVTYLLIPIPQGKYDPTAQATRVVFNDGSELGQFTFGDSRPVALEDLPEYVAAPFIVLEDRSFYTNSGVSVRGTLRAALFNLSSNGVATQGGSTITQQLVKNLYTERAKAEERPEGWELYRIKAQEFFISLKLSRQQSKDQILEGYLNNIYFGRNAYGIDNAAQSFFGVSSTQLTASQSALLAAMLPNPGRFEPLRVDEAGNPVGRQQVEPRWKAAMAGMLDAGMITAAQAREEFPEVRQDRGMTTREGQRGYLIQMVRDELTSPRFGFSIEELREGGFTIQTTFDPALMEAATTTMQKRLDQQSESSKADGQVMGSLVTLDHATGAVLALYGGPNFNTQSFNNATQGLPQGASTYKAFGLAAALQFGTNRTGGEGLGLGSMYWGGSPRTFSRHGYAGTVKNYNNGQQGWKSVIDATAASTNTIYTALNLDVGPAKTQKIAEAMGVAGPYDPESGRYYYTKNKAAIEDNLANVLGSGSPHPIDLAAAYATIASGGMYRPWFVVESVTGSDGKERKPVTSERRVLNEDAAANEIFALRRVVTGGTAAGRIGVGRPVAGKTGTSSDYLSAWFAGFTPEVTTVVGLWRQKSVTESALVPLRGVLGYRVVSGGSAPASIWNAYMKEAVAMLPSDGEFPSRSRGYGRTVNETPPKGAPTIQQWLNPTPKPFLDLNGDGTLDWQDVIEPGPGVPDKDKDGYPDEMDPAPSNPLVPIFKQPGAPDPDPGDGPAPAPVPNPAPDPAPVPNPAPDPAPVPDPGPDPAPDPDPLPKPAPGKPVDG